MRHQSEAYDARPATARHSGVPVDAAALVRFVDAAVAALDAARDEVDALNVYPVPDGDTGTNLLLTAQAAREEMAAALAQCPAADARRALAALARGALLGACGNSGVIAAQLVGALVAHLGDGTDPARDLARALGRAARDAYAAVGEPVEGTILTVARAAADAARHAAAQPAARPRDVVVAAADAAAAALAQTPDQLAVLRDAGVVDAGGRGLCVVLDVARAQVTGEPVPERPATARGEAVPDLVRNAAAPAHDDPHRHPRGGPSYEVMYLLDADDAAVSVLRRRLAPLGESLVVVGGERLWNVHVHVSDPGAAIEAGIEAGRPRRIRVTALGEVRPAGRLGRAVVAVTAGDGLAALFREAGARAVPARPGRRPDADRLLAEILESGAAEVVLLPNDRSVLSAAEAAAAAAAEHDVRVVVVPTNAQVQGLAALAVHDPHRWFEDDVVEMTAAARHARSGAVTVATRRAITTAGTCEPGDVLGVIEGDFVVIGDDLFAVARDVLERLLGGGGELVTVVSGAGGAELAERCAAYLTGEHPMVDVAVYEGGQDRYPLLVGVE